MVDEIPDKILGAAFRSEATAAQLFGPISVEANTASTAREWSSNEAIAEVIRSSSAEDWLNIPSQNTLSYRQNLLIRVECGASSKDCSIYFGARKAGAVEVFADVASTLEVVPDVEDELELGGFDVLPGPAI